MPFFWVQLANFMQPDAVSQLKVRLGSVLRESQSAALELPNTAEAVIIDIGEANDIHPRNKQDVGITAFALVRGKVAFGEDVVHSGPVYKSHPLIKDNMSH